MVCESMSIWNEVTDFNIDGTRYKKVNIESIPSIELCSRKSCRRARMSSKEYVLDATVETYLKHLKDRNAAKVTITGYRWIIQSATDALRKAGLRTDPREWTREEVIYIRATSFGHHKNGVWWWLLAVLNTYLKWYGNRVIQDMRMMWGNDEDLVPEHLETVVGLRVMDAAQGMERLVIHLEMNMGLRRVELIRLRMGSFKPDYLEVQGKGRGGGKWRKVSYHKDTMSELAAYKRIREEEIAKARAKNPQLRVPDSLFIYERGGRLYPYQKTALDNLVKGLSERVGVRFSNHILRRTYGRMLWEMNEHLPGTCPIETISNLMGHRDVRTTIRYLGIDLRDKGRGMDGLGQYQDYLRSQQTPFISERIDISGQSGI